MKVHLANFNPTKMGGGWTVSRYLFNKFNNTYDDCDIFFITSASMVERDVVVKAKQDGKKIVLRVDNHLLHSRNRNSGMTRLYEFSQIADLLIYQSKWAKDYLSLFLKKDGVVILNGVDTNMFNSNNRINNNSCLYVRSSRINEKGWEMARHWFTYNSQRSDIGALKILGKFSQENLLYNFDFYNDEKYSFLGEQPHQTLADIMRQTKYFLYSYFMDACSNTLIEARASGCEIVDVYGMLQTGGAPEIMNMSFEDLSVHRMLKEYEKVLSTL